MYVQSSAFNSGDTAWVLVCAALVLFMVPGLAFFYAGMVRRQNALVMLQQNLVPLGVISLTWVVVGYSIAFGNDSTGGWSGDLSLFGLRGLPEAPAPAMHVISPQVAIPTLAFVVYQMMFAIITPALITGATADRLKLAGWVVFIAIWSVIVYPPIAHWLFAPAGWLAARGAQDWAGGMVVHASAGAAALAVLLVVGRRRHWPNTGSMPHSVPYIVLGAGILWFGWFGFNAGDGLRAGGIASQALINSQVAAAAGMLLWLLMERVKDGHSTVVGGVSGAVAGLATITPCAGYVSAVSAIIIGALAGLVCNLALRIKSVFKLDDALDVIAVHFIGGILGSLLLGFFGERLVNPDGANGVFYGGGFGLLGNQVFALIVVVAFSFILSWVIAILIEKTIGLRVDPADETHLDLVQQNMDAYHTDRLWSVIGTTSRTDVDDMAPALPPLSPAQAEDTRLLTAYLDSVHVEELKRSLLHAGILSIAASEAHVFTGEWQTQVMRGNVIEYQFPVRMRVDVLVPAANVGLVIDALDKYSKTTGTGIVQVAEPARRA